MSETLEALFGSKIKTRILRFFLHNPDVEFSLSEVVGKNMLKGDGARKELKNLKEIKFIAEKTRQGKKYYALNRSFPFYPELRSLIIKSNTYPQCQSLGKVKSIGDVRLALISGIFLNYPRSKADMLMVANHVSRARMNNLIRNLEAEIGKEICYVLMSGDEFKYRLDMMDRFLLDFLEGPHDELINKIPKLKTFISGLKK